MSVMVKVDDLGKRYKLGENTAGYGRLTESLSNAVRRRRGEHVLPHQEIWALRNASFEIEQGEVVGLIGRNGAGKSTLLKLLARVTTPTEGRAEIHGRVGSLLEVGTGFHQELTGRENVFLSGAILGMRRSQILRRFDEIVAFAELEQYIDTPVKRYSSGMGLRLGFAVAAFLEPEVLLVDEVLAVGDLEFRRKSLGRIGEVSHDDGRTVLFVSHDLNSILSTCSRALVVNKGSIVFDGPAPDAVGFYESSVGSGRAPRRLFRREWSGDQAPLLLSARFESPAGDGQVEYGQPLTLLIETNGSTAVRRFGLEVTVVDKRHRPVAFFSSGVMQGRFYAGGETAECHIPFVPLAPGAYTVDIAARIPGIQTLDEWQGDLVFDVVRFDPFDTGSTFAANDATGPVVPEHSWSSTPPPE